MGKPIEAQQGSPFTEALGSNAQILDELHKTTTAGHYILGLSPEAIAEYSGGLKLYVDNIIRILGEKQISQLILGLCRDGKSASERRLGEEINYGGDIEAKIVLRRIGAISKLMILAEAHTNQISRQGLDNFLEGHFASTPEASWSVKEAPAYKFFAEKDLTPEDLLPKEESRFNRNGLLETFVFGLNTRLNEIKTETARLETGETTDKGLQRRITALNQANEILKQAILDK